MKTRTITEERVRKPTVPQKSIHGRGKYQGENSKYRNIDPNWCYDGYYGDISKPKVELGQTNT